MAGIRAEGRAFVDESGRQRIFSGVNYVFKGEKPAEDGVVHFENPLDDKALADLHAHGVNLIRLGFTWAGIEPEPGKYNETYLSEIREVIGRCASHGIDVYLDWHQDLWSGFGLGVGDGAPAWACLTDKKMKKPRFIWAEGYFFGGAVWECFDAFWQNKPLAGRGLRDRYCDMLEHTVRFMAGCKNVVAYDLLNEPYPGSLGGKVFRKLVKSAARTVLTHPKAKRAAALKSLLSRDVMGALSIVDDGEVYHAVIDPAEPLLRTFDTGVYYDFLCAAAAAVRRADPHGVIFFENSYYSNTGIPCSAPLPVYPDGTRETNVAFAPHGYDLTVDTPLTNVASTARVDHIFAEHRRKQLRQNVPVVVGEWGGMVAGGEEYPALEHLIALFDENAWSQTYWHYSREILDSRIFDILARPYPAAVAGRIAHFGFERESGVFTLEYEAKTCDQPTEIYLPSAPKAVEATGTWRVEEDGAAFRLFHTPTSGEQKVRVTL